MLKMNSYHKLLHIPKAKFHLTIILRLGPTIMTSFVMLHVCDSNVACLWFEPHLPLYPPPPSIYQKTIIRRFHFMCGSRLPLVSKVQTFLFLSHRWSGNRVWSRLLNYNNSKITPNFTTYWYGHTFCSFLHGSTTFVRSLTKSQSTTLIYEIE